MEVTLEGFPFHFHICQGMLSSRGSVGWNKFFYEVGLYFGKGLIFVLDDFISTFHKPSFSEGMAVSCIHFVEECQDFVFLLVEGRIHGKNMLSL